MREYYIFRYYDSKDVMKSIHEEFKCMTYEEMLKYYHELKQQHFGVAVYRHLSL